jgi:Recombination endonuclease VII
MSNDKGIHNAKRRASWNAYRQKNLEARREAERKSSWKANGLPEPTRTRPDKCECCGRDPGQRALCLDHDHDTNEFRGWLCTSCNAGIGSLGDDLEGVLNAVSYLNKSMQS